MKHFVFGILVALASCMPCATSAQGLKSSGVGATYIVPSDWESIFKTGDLNRDGISDLVIIATPCHKDNMKTRDDGYVYNFNQPVLAIYWGDKSGKYSLFKQYDKVIPARTDEFISYTPSIDINSKGSLKITIEIFATAGSWEQPTTTYTFRFQWGDFFLIGKDETVNARNTGKITTTSENYLTRKRLVTTMQAASKRKPRTTSSVLPKASLKPLGQSTLGD